MKKIFCTLLFLTFFTNSYSQENIDSITKEVCSCIEQKKEKLNLENSETLKMQLGLCILSSYTGHEKWINDNYGKVLENESAMDKFGEEIGIKMVSVCPETLISLAGAIDSDVTETTSETLTIQGKIVEIKNDQFTSIIVKDKNSRMYTFLLLNYFDTASLVTNNELSKNDSVVISYSEIELYDSKAKEFRFYKVMNGIEKK